ncbi:MAG: hypothetical protein Q7R83_03490 [bacterium]|nr:hypothetical protein [bacterium]
MQSTHETQKSTTLKEQPAVKPPRGNTRMTADDAPAACSPVVVMGTRTPITTIQFL